MSNTEPVIIDSESGLIETLPPEKGQRYRVKLDTAERVRAEMAKIYREARSGKLDTSEMNKFIWALDRIGNMIKTTDLEKRIEQLESHNS